MGGRKWNAPAKFDAKSIDEGGKPFHVQQAEQIRLYKDAWKKAGHRREPQGFREPFNFCAWLTIRTGITLDRTAGQADKVGYIEADKRAIFGRSYAAEPGSADQRAGAGRSDTGSRHLIVNHTQHLRRRLQRTCAVRYPATRRPRPGLEVIGSNSHRPCEARSNPELCVAAILLLLTNARMN